jgi:hypothetical protein
MGRQRVLAVFQAPREGAFQMASAKGELKLGHNKVFERKIS